MVAFSSSLENLRRPNGMWRIASLFALGLIVFFSLPGRVVAFEALDPTGNVTIVWDVMAWTGDGYTATVTINNYQLFRRVEAPGWGLNLTWVDGEVMWGLQGAQTTSDGNCSILAVAGGSLPYCCAVTPSILDLPATVQGPPGCCSGGLLGSLASPTTPSSSNFSITVGNITKYDSFLSFKMPTNFTLLNKGYTCSSPASAPASEIAGASGLRGTSAIMTFKVVCTYDAIIAKPLPTCCVSFSAFYNESVIPCPACSCACGNFTRDAQICDMAGNSSLPYLVSDGLSTEIQKSPSALECSLDGCGVGIHWHVKTNYADYWRSKVTITNRQLYTNYTDWNLVVEHPNFNNLTQSFSFNHTQIYPYGLNNTALMWGLVDYNAILFPAGLTGNVNNEFLFGKSPDFTFSQGWPYPRRVLFNGQECVMPTTYPGVPGAAPRVTAQMGVLLAGCLTALALVFIL